MIHFKWSEHGVRLISTLLLSLLLYDYSNLESCVAQKVVDTILSLFLYINFLFLDRISSKCCHTFFLNIVFFGNET